MHLISFNNSTDHHRDQMASLLVDAFARFESGWKNADSAQAEVGTFNAKDRLAWLALEGDTLVGWIGAIVCSKHLWELHPLAVHSDHQRKGIGKALVQRLEFEARQRGVSTIMLGTDDDFGGTSLYGKNLYPDVIGHLNTIQSVNNHPFEFYRALGYSIIGIIPDATGPGRHDILMAKRVS
ncbi:MAG: GNAT family N-acetyltransferase [Bacteroidetes bacterium]|nr:GNAT family N-acetyltransferase [Bacteroidota bacterium]MCW5897216.1 GNAT family N-acetyltransferase [Bacteroidota bacterium]